MDAVLILLEEEMFGFEFPVGVKMVNNKKVGLF